MPQSLPATCGRIIKKNLIAYLAPTDHMARLKANHLEDAVPFLPDTGQCRRCTGVGDRRGDFGIEESDDDLIIKER